MDGDLVRGLRSRAIEVITARDAGMVRRKDEDHLTLAASQGRALYSFNVGDYRASTSCSLVEAKHHTDCLLSGELVELLFPTKEAASAFCAEAAELGVIVEQETRFR